MSNILKTAVRSAALITGLWILILQIPSCDSQKGIVPSPAISPVLLVGIDGATFDRIDSLAAQGKLPTLSGLMANGVRSRLRTLRPTISPAIWTTIATGKLPAQHGILKFDGAPGSTLKTLPTSQMRRVRAFWNILSEYNRSVGVIGWWATWPAEPVNGYIVSDRATYSRMEATIQKEQRNPFEVYPSDLASEIRSFIYAPSSVGTQDIQKFMAVSDSEAMELAGSTGYRHGRFQPEFRYTYQSDRSIAAITLHLLKSHPTDMTAAVFYGVDVMSHLTWHFMEPSAFPRYDISVEDVRKYGRIIDTYYTFVDSLLGELIRAAPDEATIMVVSDHGFGPTGRLPWSGGHWKTTPGAPLAPDGILILSGPPIPSGMTVGSTHVTDLLPTLLYLQGLPIAEDMRGDVIQNAIRPNLLKMQPIRHTKTYEVSPRPAVWDTLLVAPELDQDTIEKLRNLGYLQSP